MKKLLAEIDILALIAIVVGLVGSTIACYVLWRHKRLRKFVVDTATHLDKRITSTEESVKKLLYDGK